jgi:hypothetical protein
MAVRNVAIQRIFVSHHSQNAWAFLQGVGWKKIGTLSVDGTTNVHIALVTARAHGIIANVTTNAADNAIEQVYV